MPCPEARLRPAARTVRPSNEPGYLHTARNRDSSPRPFADSNGAGAKASIFHARDGVALDGAHRRVRGREADSVAQHATESTCLRRPNDVLRNVSPASRCAASFEFTIATRIDTIKPKTSSKHDFFVHRMCSDIHHRSTHVVCTLLILHTITHQHLPSFRARLPRVLGVFFRAVDSRHDLWLSSATESPTHRRKKSSPIMTIELDILKNERDKLREGLREVEAEVRKAEADLKALRQREIQTKREIEALSTLIDINEQRDAKAPAPETG